MKNVKLYLSLLLALVLVVGTISISRVFAAENVMHVETEETDDGVTVKLVADKDLGFGGINFTITFDDAVFTLSSVSSPISSEITSGPNGYLIDAPNGPNDPLMVNTGNAVVTFVFTATDITPGTYTFTVNVLAAYDPSFTDHVPENTALSGDFVKTGESSSSDTTEAETSETDTTEEDTTEAETSETDTTEVETTEAETTAAETTAAETTPASTTAAETTPASTTAANMTAAATTQAGITPDSGDSSAMPVFIVTGCTAAVLLGVLLVIRKKSNKAE